MADVKPLHDILAYKFGEMNISGVAVPEYITNNLNPIFPIRPYQTRAFQFYLKYWHEKFDGKPRQNHQLLFHMATGSGKTLMMAGLILHLYQQGYRNFLFFVNSKNIIDKTRGNFLNPQSGKYLFGAQIEIGGKKISVREVNNFQSGDLDDINIVFETIQGLHGSLKSPRENALTFDDFADKKIVLISDEAHHINVETKKGARSSQEEMFELESWESTVQKVFEANPDNVLLEFTATVDFSDENLSKKYKPKLIFDYSLKEFRKDGYSKEVEVLQVDLPDFDRALQAVLLSQYRRKVFEKNKLFIKPVILFKSKTIKDSKAFFEEFTQGITSLTGDKVSKALDQSYYMKKLATYMKVNRIVPENLAMELKEDFSSGKLIEVNSKDESEKKQIAVNSLEAKDNEYRAVFAVDMLNEGWDVLNLFDIVRMYDTRDSKDNKLGKTTMSEAQLIGRGARYCPFRLSPDQPLDQRKYDSDLGSELRICEELIYHSAHNPKYIQELKTALHEIGIKAKDITPRDLKLKDSFKQTPLYKAGLLFLNKQEKNDRSEVTELDSRVKDKIYKISLHTGRSATETVFEDNSGTGTVKKESKDYALSSFGRHVLRKAIHRLQFYEFQNLRKYLPNLDSIDEFLSSESYMGSVKLEVSGDNERINNLTPDDKLRAAMKVLEEAVLGITVDKIEYKGTKEFKPFQIKDVINDKILNFTFDDSDNKELGKSMNNHNETAIHLDLSSRDWFVFNDCYGTSEEKLLIKYIDKRHDDLKKKYSDVYLIRNERHFKIYAFSDGRPIEPDFVLYLIGKEKSDTGYYQVFIEPKGGHLLLQDEWKEKFLQRLKTETVIEQLWNDRKYLMWGLPFFNEGERMKEFETGFNEFVG